ncbi:MAG TPA: TraB/GumN family protein, partial [Hellea balneolensis]|nr:TraB/GumN family protein [Hellea balneolensis]
VSGISDILNDPANMGDEIVYAAMLTTRNENWTQTLNTLMENETGTFFFGVGAAHLAGNDSVIAMLEAQGWNVIRQ